MNKGRFDEVCEYYKKNLLEIALKYINCPESLTLDEIERLGWESGFKEKNYLEWYLPNDDLIFKEINSHLDLKIETPDGNIFLK